MAAGRRTCGETRQRPARRDRVTIACLARAEAMAEQ
jgi:hypothetical protein